MAQIGLFWMSSTIMLDDAGGAQYGYCARATGRPMRWVLIPLRFRGWIADSAWSAEGLLLARGPGEFPGVPGNAPLLAGNGMGAL